MVIIYFFLAFYIFVVIFFFYAIYVKFLNPGAVYFPSTDSAVKTMLDLAGVGKGDIVVDFGSGDGKILIQIAKRGAEAIGYEIDPVLVWRARRKVRNLGLENKIKIYCKSYFKADLTQATVITLYTYPPYFPKIRDFIKKKIIRQVRVVANQYPMPGVEAVGNIDKVYLYKIKPIK